MTWRKRVTESQIKHSLNVALAGACRQSRSVVAQMKRLRAFLSSTCKKIKPVTPTEAEKMVVALMRVVMSSQIERSFNDCLLGCPAKAQTRFTIQGWSEIHHKMLRFTQSWQKQSN